jgi:hypothetical protein
MPRTAYHYFLIAFIHVKYSIANCPAATWCLRLFEHYHEAVRGLVRILILSAFLYWLPADAFATAVVALRTDSEIVVAADSKAVTIEGFEGKRCKTLIAPHHIFAAAGIIGQVGTFNSFDTAKRLLSTSASHAEIVASYSNEMLRVIPEVVEKIKNQAPRYFETKVRGQQVFQALFGTLENGVLKVSVVGFTPADDGSVSARQEDCPGQCDATQPWLATLGEHTLIDTEARNSHLWKDLEIFGAVSKLVDLEIEARPASVGGPVSIAFLQKDGHVGWHQSGSCAHEKQPHAGIEPAVP